MPSQLIAGDVTNGAQLNRDTDGALTIQTGAAGAKVNALALDASGNGALLGALTARAGTDVQVIRQQTTVTTLGSTNTHEWNDVPAWAKEIIVNLVAVSTNGPQRLVLSFGTAGGWVTTNYAGSAVFTGSASGNISLAGRNGFTDGFFAAANTRSGHYRLVRLDTAGHFWTCIGNIGLLDAAVVGVVGGHVDAGNLVTRIRLAIEGGSEVFDGGFVSISYRG